ncbi:hypothetical protein BS50DRAFT_214443 [Corynespora cassiicola Philippines]|uniref:Uncharacterized protein n=1 Tax=Corynespora cassiicola Philippines TaxID=1448308 RepID=A0A2T2N4X1_CORCC|nr:hypothetical protein BS50DRAFT_214443 [Corynespora cassiicola Philippines]
MPRQLRSIFIPCACRVHSSPDPLFCTTCSAMPCAQMSLASKSFDAFLELGTRLHSISPRPNSPPPPSPDGPSQPCRNVPSEERGIIILETKLQKNVFGAAGSLVAGWVSHGWALSP